MCQKDKEPDSETSREGFWERDPVWDSREVMERGDVGEARQRETQGELRLAGVPAPPHTRASLTSGQPASLSSHLHPAPGQREALLGGETDLQGCAGAPAEGRS